MSSQRPGDPRYPQDESQDDLLDLIPERLTGESDESGRGGSDDGVKSRGLLIGGLLIGVAVAGAAGFYLLPRESGTSGTVTPQLVPADGGPYKVRPADPGGMQVPNQDKLVFERSGAGGASDVENLLPEPVVPSAPPAVAQMPRPLAATDMTPPPPPLDEPAERALDVPSVVEARPAAPIPAISAAQAPVAPTAATAVAPAPVVSAPAVVPPVVPAPVVPAPVKAEEPVKAPAPQPQQTAAAAGAYTVQFAALRDDASARKLWEDLKGKHPDLLGTLSPVIQKADLGTKGVFYRVRATGLSSDAAARTLCDELAKRKVGCLFVGQ
ncbi:MAG: SPOR domain-containing protein [Rhodospirillaceae bacterium]